MDEITKKMKAAVTVNCLSDINKHLEHLKKGEAVAGIYATLNSDGEVCMTITGLPIGIVGLVDEVIENAKQSLKEEV